MTTFENTRRSTRYGLRLRLLFRREDSAYFYETTADNISVGGVFIETRRQLLETDTPVLLMLTDEKIGENLPLQGRVAWVREDSEDAEGPPGMGISFDDMSDEQRQALEDVLQRAAAE